MTRPQDQGFLNFTLKHLVCVSQPGITTASYLLTMSIPRYQPECGQSLVDKSQHATFKINFPDDSQAP